MYIHTVLAVHLKVRLSVLFKQIKKDTKLNEMNTTSLTTVLNEACFSMTHASQFLRKHLVPV